MKRLALHLWYDQQATKAVRYYCSIFKNTKIHHHYFLEETPSGAVTLTGFQIEDMVFEAFDGGPFFTINSSVTLALFCTDETELRQYYQALQGTVIKPLPAQTVWPSYGVVRDEYGLYWILTLNPGSYPFKIIPCIHFLKSMGDVFSHYVKHLPLAQVDEIEPNHYAILHVEKSPLMLAQGLVDQEISFTAALSMIYLCASQKEIDSFYRGFSSEEAAEKCGWIQDRYGFYWQIVPDFLLDNQRQMHPSVFEQINRRVLEMTKLDYELLYQMFEEDIIQKNK